MERSIDDQPCPVCGGEVEKETEQIGPVKMRHFQCTQCDFACDLNTIKDTDGVISMYGSIGDIEIGGSIQKL